MPQNGPLGRPLHQLQGPCMNVSTTQVWTTCSMARLGDRYGRGVRADAPSAAPAISESCSVNDEAPQPARGQPSGACATPAGSACRTPGGSAGTTWRSPLDHSGPPQPSQLGPGARRRMCTLSGAPLPVVDAEHLDVPESHDQLADARRVSFHRDPPVVRSPVSADSGGSLACSRGCPLPLMPPHFRRAGKPWSHWWAVRPSLSHVVGSDGRSRRSDGWPVVYLPRAHRITRPTRIISHDVKQIQRVVLRVPRVAVGGKVDIRHTGSDDSHIGLGVGLD